MKRALFAILAGALLALPAAANQNAEQLSASHILIQYKGSMRAGAAITRTKEEALARCKEAIAKLDEGADFAELAKEYSDGPSGPRGGMLGVFPASRMAAPFSAGVTALEVGAYSKAPVETQFGYHVILRHEVELYGARHILVQYEGSTRSQQTRTKEEALARAEEVLAKAKEGADFAELAKEFSDGPSGPSGGDLGTFAPGAMVPAFEEGMLKVEPGNLVPELVETQFGYHLIYRTH